MDATNTLKKATRADWHRADIISALRKKGWSLSRLSLRVGLGARTLNAALSRPYPKAEKIIAEVIGVTPETIWPERYAKRNFTPTLPPSLLKQVKQNKELNAAA